MIKSLGGKIYNLALLTNSIWIEINENSGNKFIFQANGSLLISDNGVVTNAKWKQVNGSGILIEFQNGSFLYDVIYSDNNIFVLRSGANNINLVNERNVAQLGSIQSIKQYFNKKMEENNRRVESKVKTKKELNRGLDLIGNVSKILLIIFGILIGMLFIFMLLTEN